MTKINSTNLLYCIFFILFVLSFSTMYVELVINKNFYQYTVDDEEPDSYSLFIYNKDKI